MGAPVDGIAAPHAWPYPPTASPARRPVRPAFAQTSPGLRRRLSLRSSGGAARRPLECSPFWPTPHRLGAPAEDLGGGGGGGAPIGAQRAALRLSFPLLRGRGGLPAAHSARIGDPPPLPHLRWLRARRRQRRLVRHRLRRRVPSGNGPRPARLATSAAPLDACRLQVFLLARFSAGQAFHPPPTPGCADWRPGGGPLLAE